MTTENPTPSHLPLEVVASDCSKHLEKIAKNFKNPKITLLVRAPDLPDGSGDFLMTRDNIGDVITALQRLEARGPA